MLPFCIITHYFLLLSSLFSLLLLFYSFIINIILILCATPIVPEDRFFWTFVGSLPLIVQKYILQYSIIFAVFFTLLDFKETKS